MVIFFMTKHTTHHFIKKNTIQYNTMSSYNRVASKEKLYKELESLDNKRRFRKV